MHVLREMERLHYRTSIQLASASELGFPHERQRVFFVAVERDIVSDAARLRRDWLDRARHAESETERETRSALGQTSVVRSQIGVGCAAPGRVSGPGGAQKPWEYPRIIDLNAKTKTIAPVGGAGYGGRPALGCSSDAFRDSETWRTAIRLLGNGVVPAVAELAIRRGLKEIFCSKV
jgi:hypothetical protein